MGLGEMEVLCGAVRLLFPMVPDGSHSLRNFHKRCAPKFAVYIISSVRHIAGSNTQEDGIEMKTPTERQLDFRDLTIAERIELAQQLWESVRDQIEATPLTETEVAEIKWRIDQINVGLMVCEPFDAVLARAAAR